MNRAFVAAVLGALLFCGVACKSQKADDKEAIRQGVVTYLTSLKGLNIPNMDIVVTQYSVNGNQAQAQVEIRAKGGDAAGGSMQLAYNLERRGDQWVVLKSQPAGGTLQHPGPGEIPPGATMPPGHPAVGGSSTGQPVHSDLNEIMKSAQPPAQKAPAQQPPPSTNPPSKP
jgi:hypothetical protein